MQRSNTVHRYVDPSQVQEMREAALSQERETSQRDEVIVVLLADLGLRASELVGLRRSAFRLDKGEVQLSTEVQKDYPTDHSPRPARMELDPYEIYDTVRLLRRYFSSEWWTIQSGDYVVPTRQSAQASTQTIRNVIKRVAEKAEVEPYRTDGQPSSPDEMHPHALRHSVASMMLSRDARLVEVRNRLRHRSIQTTEQIYEHFRRR